MKHVDPRESATLARPANGQHAFIKVSKEELLAEIESVRFMIEYDRAKLEQERYERDEAMLKEAFDRILPEPGIEDFEAAARMRAQTSLATASKTIETAGIKLTNLRKTLRSFAFKKNTKASQLTEIKRLCIDIVDCLRRTQMDLVDALTSTPSSESYQLAQALEGYVQGTISATTTLRFQEHPVEVKVGDHIPFDKSHNPAVRQVAYNIEFQIGTILKDLQEIITKNTDLKSIPCIKSASISDDYAIKRDNNVEPSIGIDPLAIAG